jgi:hypothetical protein
MEPVEPQFGVEAYFDWLRDYLSNMPYPENREIIRTLLAKLYGVTTDEIDQAVESYWKAKGYSVEAAQKVVGSPL